MLNITVIGIYVMCHIKTDPTFPRNEPQRLTLSPLITTIVINNYYFRRSTGADPEGVGVAGGTRPPVFAPNSLNSPLN